MLSRPTCAPQSIATKPGAKRACGRLSSYTCTQLQARVNKETCIRASRGDFEEQTLFDSFELRTGIFLSTLLFPDVSYATASTSYDPSTGSEFLVNAAGAGYVLLVAYFLFRVLSKRAKRFREEKIADSPSLFSSSESANDGTPQASTPERKDLTVMDGLIGVLQSGVLTVGLFIFTRKVDALILSTPLPEQYTAHNIAVTVRTIIRGFCYLFTFVFGMNFLGLTGLTIKLMVDPDSVNKDASAQPVNTKPQLPKISVVSDPEEVARAFDEVSKKSTEKKR